MPAHLRIKDHRGRRYTIIDAKLLAPEVDLVLTRELRRLAYRPWALVVYGLLGLLLAMAMSNLVRFIIAPTMAHAAHVLLTLALLVMVATVVRSIVSVCYVQICLQHGYCPSCGYCLSEVPAQPDRCRLCPECGAAWYLRDAL
jgi:hypothetical protein